MVKSQQKPCVKVICIKHTLKDFFPLLTFLKKKEDNLGNLVCRMDGILQNPSICRMMDCFRRIFEKPHFMYKSTGKLYQKELSKGQWIIFTANTLAFFPSSFQTITGIQINRTAVLLVTFLIIYFISFSNLQSLY